MNTATRHRSQEKSRVNGKWISKAIDHGEREALAKGQVILEMAQDTAEDLLNSGSKLAEKAGAKAITFGKSHPVQVAIGGITLGFMLGSRLFGRHK